MLREALEGVRSLGAVKMMLIFAYRGCEFHIAPPLSPRGADPTPPSTDTTTDTDRCTPRLSAAAALDSPDGYKDLRREIAHPLHPGHVSDQSYCGQ
jgi:hypothetical protein